MREIKFRAWDKETKVMVYDFDADIQEGGLLKFITGLGGNGQLFCGTEGDWRELELMQYTGLKDKNGKEIYEGDIVLVSYKHSSGFVHQKAIVQFFGGGFQPLTMFFGGECQDGELFEVLGNIYENPELKDALK